MMQWKSERAPADGWEWLIDSLAEELAAMPDADARYILARLDDRAGYRLVSELAAMAPVETRRRDLVDRLMARAGRGPHGAHVRPPISRRPVAITKREHSAMGD